MTELAAATYYFRRVVRRLLMETMLSALTAPALTFVFLGVVVSLGSALVWAFWEIERASGARRNVDRAG